ncbi:hypothetical protein Q7P36_001097 [Cladosporium allicinum]
MATNPYSSRLIVHIIIGLGGTRGKERAPSFTREISHRNLTLCITHLRTAPLDVSAHMGVRTFYSILAAINVGFLCFSIVTGHSKDDPLYDPKPPRKGSKQRKT